MGVFWEGLGHTKRAIEAPIMSNYVKVWLKVLDSSIAEDYRARHVFEDLLKLADWRTGEVDMTRQAIARRLAMPLSELNEQLQKLEAPDPRSRHQAEDGRRLVRLDDRRDWGWRIVNWERYNDEARRAAAVERVRKHRMNKVLSEESGSVSVAARAQGGAITQEPPKEKSQKRGRGASEKRGRRFLRRIPGMGFKDLMGFRRGCMGYPAPWRRSSWWVLGWFLTRFPRRSAGSSSTITSQRLGWAHLGRCSGRRPGSRGR